MVIGILDLDLLYDARTYEVNIDVMQIASYHRKIGDKVKLCFTTDLEKIGWLNTIYIIYNGEKELAIDRLLKSDNIVLVGKYFYDKYYPLSQEIKDSYPDTTIYENPKFEKFLTPTKLHIIRNKIKKSDFIRLHEPSNLKFLTTNPEVVIFDQDIDNNDYDQIVKLNKKVNFYFPIVVRSYSQADKWLKANAYSRSGGALNFIAENCTEEDYKKLLQLPPKQRMMFTFVFANCEPSHYNIELKKLLRLIQIAKFMSPIQRIKIKPINNKTYEFLFDCAKRWLSSPKAKDGNSSIFQIYFNNKDKYDLSIKIKAKDPELYQLLNYTLSVRYQDEQGRKYNRRLD